MKRYLFILAVDVVASRKVCVEANTPEQAELLAYEAAETGDWEIDWDNSDNLRICDEPVEVPS